MNVATALTRARRGLLSFLAFAGLSAIAAGAAMAQGVTTGAVRGRVLDQQGAPITSASLQLVNRNSGSRYIGTTSANGTFFIANVIIGPYLIEARAIGFRPAGRSDITVTLGQAAEVELRLEAAAIEVEAIAVTGAGENDLLSRSRTGVTALVTENLIDNLPSLNRNFNDFTRTSALVNGNSIAGQADRFNSLQIDGGSNGDLFGLNASRGSPGGRNDSRPLSVEAVREFQVLIAPFDVRQGGFTGGLVNAVTKSGTNEFHGSVFGFTQSDALQGKDSLGNSAPEFDRRYYGFSVGGPIIRDRFHFFAAAEWRAEEGPLNTVRNIDLANPASFSNPSGISATTAGAVRDFAINTLGFDPGDFGQPTIPNPDRNFFLKLSGQLGSRNQVELSYNNVSSSLRVSVHDPFGANPTRLREGYQFGASGYDNTHDNSSLRLRLNSQITPTITNEAIVSFYQLEDVRAMTNRVSLMIVGADSLAANGLASAHLALGGERFSQANTLDQNITEIANNLTLSMGDHVFTIGGRAERFKFNNVFFPASLGAWYFPDTTAFFAQAPTRYERALPAGVVDPLGRSDGPIADFTFSQFGLYGQDQWRVTNALTLTLGLRFDFTSLPQPTYNPRIDSALITVGPRAGQLLGVRTDSRPTDATLISPRFGFNYDVRGDQSLLIRGGAGIFSGRTPYVWASNAYTNTGLEQVQLVCTGANVPTFEWLPANQHDACAAGPAPSLPRPAIVYFDPNFKLPQSARLALGLDHRLPWNLVGMVDLMYSRAVNQFLLEDVNLVPGGHSTGEGNRQLYGTLNATSGSSTPRRATTAANDIIRQYNSNRDYAWSAKVGLVKRFANDLEFQAEYAYMRSYDLISPTSDISNSLLNFATLDGTFAERSLTPSLFDTPHNVRLSGTAGLPYGFRVSLFYTGSSGRPYAYRYNSDVNGDGFSGNDLFYVPLNSSDITMATPAQYTQLDAFIQGEKCLREQRGRIMERSSCRNPWRAFLDARVAKTFHTIRGQNIEITMNMFNVLSFLGVGGQIRSTSGFENVALLNRTGYSAGMSRGIYSLLLPQRNVIDVTASRWKLEFGARYSF